MMHLRSILVVSLALISGVALVAAQQTLPQKFENIPQQQNTCTQLTVKLYEKRGEATVTLAESSIQVVDGQPFSSFSGGEVEATSPPLQFGTRIDGVLTEQAKNHFHMALKISVGNRIPLHEPDVSVVKSHGVDLRLELKRNQTKTIPIDSVTWLELRLE